MFHVEHLRIRQPSPGLGRLTNICLGRSGSFGRRNGAFQGTDFTRAEQFSYGHRLIALKLGSYSSWLRGITR
jgi:hypothetical protein